MNSERKESHERMLAILSDMLTALPAHRCFMLRVRQTGSNCLSYLLNDKIHQLVSFTDYIKYLIVFVSDEVSEILSIHFCLKFRKFFQSKRFLLQVEPLCNFLLVSFTRPLELNLFCTFVRANDDWSVGYFC